MTTKQSTAPIGPDTVMLGGSIERKDRTGWVHMQIFVRAGASPEEIAAAVQTWRETYDPAMTALYAQAGYSATLDGQAPAQLAEPEQPSDPGAIVVTFGTHKDRTIREIWETDPGYVSEFLAKKAFQPRIKEAAAAFVAALSPDRYLVDTTGAIISERGEMLYEADAIADLSPEAKQRLAELHTADPDLAWEGDDHKPGAWQILTRENLLPPSDQAAPEQAGATTTDDGNLPY